MRPTVTAPVKHAIARVRRVWTELDNAERRLFEIRTGTLATARRSERGSHRVA